MWHTHGMNPPATTNLYKRHRFPGEIIRHSVWLYYRFSLSYRDVEELMAERGVTMSHEAMRYWCRKFGQTYANRLRRRRPRPGDKWHLDEVFLTIHGERQYLWRAADQAGHGHCQLIEADSVIRQMGALPWAVLPLRQLAPYL
jgi:putative transposase